MILERRRGQARLGGAQALGQAVADPKEGRNLDLTMPSYGERARRLVVYRPFRT